MCFAIYFVWIQKRHTIFHIQSNRSHNNYYLLLTWFSFGFIMVTISAHKVLVISRAIRTLNFMVKNYEIFTTTKKEKKIRTTLSYESFRFTKTFYFFFFWFFSFVYLTLYHIPIFVIMNRKRITFFRYDWSHPNSKHVESCTLALVYLIFYSR